MATIAMMPPTTYSSHIGIVILIAHPPWFFTIVISTALQDDFLSSLITLNGIYFSSTGTI